MTKRAPAQKALDFGRAYGVFKVHGTVTGRLKPVVLDSYTKSAEYANKMIAGSFINTDYFELERRALAHWYAGNKPRTPRKQRRLRAQEARRAERTKRAGV